jgi:hypothetical protein
MFLKYAGAIMKSSESYWNQYQQVSKNPLEKYDKNLQRIANPGGFW